MIEVASGPTRKPVRSTEFMQATTPASSTPQNNCRKVSRVFGGSGLTAPAAA
jgi:hypothetical protein